jgi:glyoxylase-like metal-dependent hydrolase (beta-lactamase superfamily II)
MLEGAVDGVAADEEAARDTLRRIRALAQQESLVYLPAHDPASAERLLTRQTVVVPRD